jgi:hypothetical protein
MFFLLLLLDDSRNGIRIRTSDKRIRIQEAQNIRIRIRNNGKMCVWFLLHVRCKNN